MRKGHSGATVELKDGKLVKQMQWMDDGFRARRPAALIRICNDLECLPRLYAATEAKITMEFIDGAEGFSAANASAVGRALRELHAYEPFDVPITNGVTWVLDKANVVLRSEGRSELPTDLIDRWSKDATVHGEPVQVIEQPGGRIVFIDIDGIGRGSRYQDLGYVRYRCDLYASSAAWTAFAKGYGAADFDPAEIDRAAGLVALAYANFYERSRRVEYGLRRLGGN